ncbi:MAG: DUF1272 domain-containing protein [Trichocoleus desertorum ATA4-8-CV12]|nr:DUF1272 domain-containing protein [Trichocoleus desertorum ATA4-8-CV12]
MLELRPSCERCDVSLAPDSQNAWICSFECTFCSTCANHLFNFSCPNCGGELVPRPTRRGEALQNNPAGTYRIYRPSAIQS